ncbi:MAG: MGDG synthase family glycosyltransferase [Elusimicrobiota bacterium]
MANAKRILFMHTLSSGHQRAAEAVISALRRVNPRVEAHQVDTFAHTYPVVGPLVSRMYLEVLEHTPLLWSYLYDNPAVEQATREIRGLLNVFKAGKVEKLIKQLHPSCLVCTQAVPAALLASLKKRGRLHLPLVGVVTDYGVHSYWLSRHVDLYLVGADEVKRDMVRRGVKESRVLVTGIPVDPRFMARGRREEERRRLGLDPNVPTVLIMGGNKGLGPVEDKVAALKSVPAKVQVIAVCGHNREAQANLEARHGRDPSVKIFGFTRNVHRLMDAADLLVSKPGGLTCAESLAKGLPLVIVHAIPGQEERNARYLLKHGAAERVRDLAGLAAVVERLLRDPEALASLRRRALELAKPRAAFDAAEAILQLSGETAPGHAPRPDRPASRRRASASFFAASGPPGAAPAAL